jgi:fatty aldehyde-generating acyl-ACP reductase
MSTNTPETFIDIRSIRTGTIICDISQPRNVSPEEAARRNDILVIDGGVVEPPGAPNFNIYFGLPPGLTYACLGETIILALEKKYESYSIGGNISAQKVREIALLGEKHGFQLAELKSFGSIIPKQKFEEIQTVRKA